MKHQLNKFVFGCIGILLCYYLWNTDFFWLIISLLVVVYFSIVGLGSYFIHFNYHIPSISKVDSEGVVFTFDDGPDPEKTPQILDILEEFKIKATFFMIGSQVEKHPEIVRQVIRKGHTVGNHSYSHSNFIPFFKVKKLDKDFKKSQKAILDVTGYLPLLIRPPFGATSPNYWRFYKKNNLISIGWKVRSFDTKNTDVDIFVKKTVDKTVNNKGAICLFHDTQNLTVQALPKIISELNSKGIKIVSLSETLTKPIYETH